MNLWDSLRHRPTASENLSLNDLVSLFKYDGINYPAITQTYIGGKQDEILPELSALSDLAFKSNGIVFACVATRMQLFAQAKFKFRPKRSFNSGDLFGAASLGLLEEPWARAKTSNLLARMSMDADLAGNSYVFRESDTTLRIARPDWMTIVLGTEREDGNVGDIDTEIIGYIYRPPGGEAKVLLPEHVAHFAPVPDPMLPFRGMSWLQPVIEEIRADKATTTHKLKFLENGATANMVVTLNSITDPVKFNEWVDKFEEDHKGVLNAYKTIYLAGGADAKVVGADLKQIDFSATQAHGETRIANAARIPAIVLGISEGLDKSSYANYAIARRHFADSTMRPLWTDACGALSTLIEIPNGAELWYEDRGIPWLADDQKEVAETQQLQAATIASLVSAGFESASVIEAVESGDLSKLKHTGLYSVQLHPPGTDFSPTPQSDPPVPKPDSAKNGNGALVPSLPNGG